MNLPKHTQDKSSPAPEAEYAFALSEAQQFYRSAMRAAWILVALGCASVITGVYCALQGDGRLDGLAVPMQLFGLAELLGGVYLLVTIAKRKSSVADTLRSASDTASEHDDIGSLEPTLYRVYQAALITLFVGMVCSVGAILMDLGYFLNGVGIGILIHSGIALGYALVWRFKVGIYLYALSKL